MPEKLPPDQDLLSLLADRQKRITGIELGGPLPSPITTAPNATSYFPEWLATLKELTIPQKIHDLRDLQWYNSILQRAHRLEILGICVSKAVDQDVDATMDDTTETTGSLSKTLFSHIAPFGASPALQLEDLSLDTVCLAARPLIDVIDFTKLKNLSIRSCLHGMAILSALETIFRKQVCALQEFKYGGYGEDFAPLESFLKACPRLTTLLVHCTSITGQEKFDVQCLSKHLPALRIFGLLWVTKEAVQACPVGEALREELHTLSFEPEELAVCMPKALVSSAVSSEYKDALATVCKCRALRVLRIWSWPTAPNNCFHISDGDNVYMYDATGRRGARYLCLLDVFATRVLRLITAYRKQAGLSPIVALAFGCTSPLHDENGRLNTMVSFPGVIRQKARKATETYLVPLLIRCTIA